MDRLKDNLVKAILKTTVLLVISSMQASIPYSGKFSRDKIFSKFELQTSNCRLFAKFIIFNFVIKGRPLVYLLS